MFFMCCYSSTLKQSAFASVKKKREYLLQKKRKEDEHMAIEMCMKQTSGPVKMDTFASGLLSIAAHSKLASEHAETECSITSKLKPAILWIIFHSHLSLTGQGEAHQSFKRSLLMYRKQNKKNKQNKNSILIYANPVTQWGMVEWSKGHLFGILWKRVAPANPHDHFL